MNYLLGKFVPFSKIFPSSRSLNLLKKGLESPGKVLEFHQRAKGGHPAHKNLASCSSQQVVFRITYPKFVDRFSLLTNLLQDVRFLLVHHALNYTRKNAQVVTNLFTSCQQVIFALFVPSRCNKFGTSC